MAPTTATTPTRTNKPSGHSQQAPVLWASLSTGLSAVGVPLPAHGAGEGGTAPLGTAMWQHLATEFGKTRSLTVSAFELLRPKPLPSSTPTPPSTSTSLSCPTRTLAASATTSTSAVAAAAASTIAAEPQPKGSAVGPLPKAAEPVRGPHVARKPAFFGRRGRARWAQGRGGVLVPVDMENDGASAVRAGRNGPGMAAQNGVVGARSAEKRPLWALGLEGWKDEPPSFNVTVPQGCLCQLESHFTIGLPPDMVFDIITDPGNSRVFKGIKEVVSREVLSDSGGIRRVVVDQAAIWRFLWMSGTFSVCLVVEEDHATKRRMSFKLARPGFMKEFKGRWDLKPRVHIPPQSAPARARLAKAAAREGPSQKGGLFGFFQRSSSPEEPPIKGVGTEVTVVQVVQPSFLPPPPIDRYVRGISVQATKDVVKDFLHEAERLRAGRSEQEDAALAADEKKIRREELLVKQPMHARRPSRLFADEERKRFLNGRH